MAHELRTPITTIYAGSTVLAREKSLPPKAAQHLAADISAEAARLYDVVEDLITLARLESTGLEPLREPVVLGRLIDGVIRVMTDRGVEVTFERTGTDILPPVDVDAAFVDQAARNVAVALVRWSSARAVDVRLDHEPVSDEVRVAFRPQSTRHGSPPNEQAASSTSLRAFPPGPAAPTFDFTADSSVGIGLFVARELIEATGGRIWSKDEGDGSFELGFALPTSESRERSTEPT
jgi:two-component system sensor histidine kinase KdpD